MIKWIAGWINSKYLPFLLVLFKTILNELTDRSIYLTTHQCKAELQHLYTCSLPRILKNLNYALLYCVKTKLNLANIY